MHENAFHECQYVDLSSLLRWGHLPLDKHLLPKRWDELRNKDHRRRSPAAYLFKSWHPNHPKIWGKWRIPRHHEISVLNIWIIWPFLIKYIYIYIFIIIYIQYTHDIWYNIIRDLLKLLKMAPQQILQTLDSPVSVAPSRLRVAKPCTTSMDRARTKPRA
jgi:hypothetical protein